MPSIVVPTLNAAADWPSFSAALLRAAPPSDILVIDSSSNDGTADLARSTGFRVVSIERSAFNHGGTRQMGAELWPQAEVIVYLTQDAVLASADAIQKLVRPFEDPRVVAAYGRQLPRPGAGPIEAHARLFNYPDRSDLRDLESRDQLGFKAIFISNSFAAYRRAALMAQGGFPKEVIFGEDTVTAGRLLLAGGRIAYVADACAYHSHAYTLAQEFRRYFDIGVLHNREGWLLEKFGNPGGEGRRFVRSEAAYLLPRAPWLIPTALLRAALKFAGYRLGRLECRMSPEVKERLSMHRGYWLHRS